MYGEEVNPSSQDGPGGGIYCCTPCPVRVKT